MLEPSTSDGATRALAPPTAETYALRGRLSEASRLVVVMADARERREIERRTGGPAPLDVGVELATSDSVVGAGPAEPDPKRAVEVADRAMTIAQVDEPLGLLCEPVADRDGFFRSEVQRPWIHQLPSERLVARGQRAAAHHVS